jgi:hypothetical protein
VITEFLNNPIVMPLWALGILSLAVFVLTVWRAIEGGQFDLSKLPKLLDTLVLKKLVPLAVLGITTYAVTDPVTRDGLIIAYSGGVVIAAAAEVKQLIAAVAGESLPPDVSMTAAPDG